MTTLSREDLKPLILEALGCPGRSASIVEIAKYIWTKCERELIASGDFFYTWQYDMRWAGNGLVKTGHIDKTSQRGSWKRLK